MLMMFFLKVRLNFDKEEIGYRFGVHKSTASRYFHHVLNLLYVKTKQLIHWPDRETLYTTMPASFHQFLKKCAVIIDCTEIFSERPSGLLARAQMWSNYKHHSTIKFLISITPQGTISYTHSVLGVEYRIKR